jgi:hypothetical protein
MMTAKEAKALVDSKPERDAEALREYQERQLKKAYTRIENAAKGGYTQTFVDKSAYMYQALIADGYVCERCGEDTMVVSWEDPK